MENRPQSIAEMKNEANKKRLNQGIETINKETKMFYDVNTEVVKDADMTISKNITTLKQIIFTLTVSLVLSGGYFIKDIYKHLETLPYFLKGLPALTSIVLIIVQFNLLIIVFKHIITEKLYWKVEQTMREVISDVIISFPIEGSVKEWKARVMVEAIEQLKQNSTYRQILSKGNKKWRNKHLGDDKMIKEITKHTNKYVIRKQKEIENEQQY